MVKYSPLCDTDLLSYLAYLLAVSEDGSRVVNDRRINGAGAVQGCYGGSGDVIQRLFDLVTCKIAGDKKLLGVSANGGGDVESADCVGSSFERSVESTTCGFSGIRIVCSDDGGCGVDCRESDEKDQCADTGDCGFSIRTSASSEIGEQDGKFASISGVHGVRSDGVSVGRNHARNRAWRAEKQRKKIARKEKKEEEDQEKKERKSLLQESAEKKWQALNDLAAHKARRNLLVAKRIEELVTVDEEARRGRTKLVADIERNMVNVENYHSALKLSGNISDEDSSRVQTILSESGGKISSGTISPNSSVSEAEVRKLQKDFADVKKRNEELVDRLEALTGERVSSGRDFTDQFCRATFTDNTENGDMLNDMYEGRAVMHDIIKRDGKRKLRLRHVGGHLRDSDEILGEGAGF